MKILRSLYKNRRKGFTLMETMVTLGIVVILLAIAIPSIVAVRRSLSFRELDNSAQAVYLAAQSNMTVMRRDGGLVALANADGVKSVPERDNAGMAEGDWNENLRYTVSGTAAFDLIVPAATVDAELRSGSMLIEYDPVTGYVYSVFYSEQDAVLSYDGLSRDESERKGLKLGYYCGGIMTIAATEVNSSEIVLLASTDEQELIVSVQVPVPDSYTEYQDVFFENLRVVLTVRGEDSGAEYTIEADKLSKELCIGSPNYVEFSCVLDSLHSALGLEALNTAMEQGKKHFTLGENLSFEAAMQFDAPEGYRLLSYDNVLLTGVNSLFSRVEKADGTYVIDIANGRHLQNLNRLDSEMAKAVASIRLTDDINWNDTLAYYTAAYAPESNNTYALFAPLDTSNYTHDGTAFDGQTHKILYLNIDVTGQKIAEGEAAGSVEAGLFGKCTIAVKDLTLVSPIVKGSGEAGALAGAAVGGAAFENCAVYIDTKDDGFSRNMLDKCGVSGATVGGLVGKVAGANGKSISFTNCFAAVDVTGTETNSTAGGFVGTAENASFEQCYASGNVKASTAGGFVGESAYADYNRCFASGSVYATATTGFAGGFVGNLTHYYSEKVTFSECYAAGVVDGEKNATLDGFCGNGLTLPTGETKTDYFADKVYEKTYYWNRDPENASLCAEAKEYTDLMSADLMKDRDESQTVWQNVGENKTHAYSLNVLGGYPFVVYGEIEYYGDWPELTGPVVLAYYEKYKDDEDTTTEDIGYYVTSEESSTLQNDRTILEDGYVLLAQGSEVEGADGTNLEALKDGDDSVTVNGYTAYKVTGASDTGFYKTMTVTVKSGESETDTKTYTLYYNPDFALTQLNPSYKADGTVDEGAKIDQRVPDEIYIRTARQLAALMDNETYQNANDYNYVQLLDVDFTKYGTTNVTATAQTIETFAGSYTGSGGYVERAKIVMKDATSLFGTVSGKVEDIQVIYETSCPSGNALATSVSGTLTNCDVSISGTTSAPIGTVTESGKVTGCDVIASSLSGATAGFVNTNEGTISECTVAPDGNEKTEGVKFGFAAKNSGTITSCMANTAATDAAFVGENTGTIRSCYAWYSGTTETKGSESGTTVVFAVTDDGTIVSAYAAVYNTPYALVYDTTGAAALRDSWDRGQLGYGWYMESSGYPYCVPNGIRHRGGWTSGSAASYTGYYYYEQYEMGKGGLGLYIVRPDDATTEEDESIPVSTLRDTETITAGGYGVFTMTVKEKQEADEATAARSLDGAPSLPAEVTDMEALVSAFIKALNIDTETKEASLTFTALGSGSVYVLGGREINTSFAPERENGAFTIRTGEQFAAMQQYPGASFVQQRDITVTAPLAGFDGVYDGGEHTITYAPTGENAGVSGGLFGDLTGTVKYVVLENTVLNVAPESADKVFGVLADTAYKDAKISNCRVVNPTIAVTETAKDGEQINATAVIGGLVGENHGTIEFSSVEGMSVTYIEAKINDMTTTTTYTANYTVGGLVGVMAEGRMEECFATGTIGAEDKDKGYTKFTKQNDETVRLGAAVGAEDASGKSEDRAVYVNCYAAVTMYANESATVGSFVGAVQDGDFSVCCGWGGGAWYGESVANVTLTDCYYYMYDENDAVTVHRASEKDVVECDSVSALAALLNGDTSAVWSAETTEKDEDGNALETYDTRYPVFAGRYDERSCVTKEATAFAALSLDGAEAAVEANVSVPSDETPVTGEPTEEATESEEPSEEQTEQPTEESSEETTEETTAETPEPETTPEPEVTPEPAPEAETETPSEPEVEETPTEEIAGQTADDEA